VTVTTIHQVRAGLPVRAVVAAQRVCDAQSKGLEWPVVFVVRMNEGVLPFRSDCHQQLAFQKTTVGAMYDLCVPPCPRTRCQPG
jgi:hypothetical protein